MKLSSPQAIEIYEAYPRKIAKPEALRAILKAIARDGFNCVLARTQLFASKAADAMRFDYEQRFIPYPATFFNREQYNDDFDAMFPKAKPKANTKVRPVHQFITDLQKEIERDK